MSQPRARSGHVLRALVPLGHDGQPQVGISRAPTDRDRLLWRMAYETSARAEELLGQDVGDLDPRRREGL